MNSYSRSSYTGMVPATWILRAILPALLVCSTLNSNAQRSRELTYKVTFTGTIAALQEKFILDAFYGQDPAMVLSLDLAQMQGKVRTTVALDVNALRNALEPVGVGVTLTTPTPPDGMDQRSTLAPDFPTCIDTGDPITDQADYEARKQAWITAHPQAYQELLQLQR